ncbi:hypothetical protein MAHJHV33_47260 [Mycobacterium avium subsp. hominissuis]
MGQHGQPLQLDVQSVAALGVRPPGDALHVELQRLAGQVSQWSRASGEIAAAPRRTARRRRSARRWATNIPT